jgi:hypothetical protein
MLELLFVYRKFVGRWTASACFVNTKNPKKSCYYLMYIRVPVLSHPRHNWRGKRITDTVIYLPFLIQKPPPWDNSNFKHSEGNRHVEELGEKKRGCEQKEWLVITECCTFLFTWTLGSKCTRETGWNWAYYCRGLSRPELAQFVAAGFETTWHVPNTIWKPRVA